MVVRVVETFGVVLLIIVMLVGAWVAIGMARKVGAAWKRWQGRS